MNGFQLSSLRNSSVWGLYRLKDRIEMNPFYQREGDIWNRDKQQLLIDTIINQFDVPKIYLHKHPQPIERDGKTYEYAVIDGKQRLTATWNFIDGVFPLSKEFVYIRSDDDEPVMAADLTYADLARKYPNLKTDFDSYALDVVCIETDDIEIIEELFSRLNEAVPLSSAEKRNALQGPLPRAVREIAQHPFFRTKLPFTNRRYRHYDLAAKMLFVTSRGGIIDTKKAYLDRFFEKNRDQDEAVVNGYLAETIAVLDAMRDVFVDGDPLLRQIGMVLLYFHLFRSVLRLGLWDTVNRESLVVFDEQRRSNRLNAENDIAEADYDLLEFDRYAQSPNDAIAMRFRMSVIDKKMFDGKLAETCY
jgi:hypothetical protein